MRIERWGMALAACLIGAGCGGGSASGTEPTGTAGRVAKVDKAGEFTTSHGFTLRLPAGWQIGGAGDDSLTVADDGVVAAALVVTSVSAFAINADTMPDLETRLAEAIGQKNPGFQSESVTSETLNGVAVVRVRGVLEMAGKPPMRLSISILQPKGADKMLELTCVVVASKAATHMQPCESVAATATFSR